MGMLNMDDHDLLTRIDERVEQLFDRLFGEDNNPGEIETMKRRTTSLEEFKWKIVGALTLLSIVGVSNVAALIYVINNSIRVVK